MRLRRGIAFEFLKADEKIFKRLRFFPLLRLLFIPHALACQLAATENLRNQDAARFPICDFDDQMGKKGNINFTPSMYIVVYTYFLVKVTLTWRAPTRRVVLVLSPVGMHHATSSRRHPSQKGQKKYGQRGSSFNCVDQILPIIDHLPILS